VARALRDSLSNEERAAFDAAKGVKAEVAPEIITPVEPTTPEETPATPPEETEVISFGEITHKEEPEATAVDFTPEQLAALGEDVRKKLTERDKENVKLRKRAQEVEAQIKERESALEALKTQLEEATQNLNDSQARGGLSGNLFGSWQDAKAVGTWGSTGKAILDKFNQISKAAAEGQEITEDLLTHTLPNGTQVKLNTETFDSAQRWIEDAGQWFRHDQEVMAAKEKVKPIVEKHKGLTGYTAAREAYLKDSKLSTRMEELVAKAALYDVLDSRGADIRFPGKAGAATSALPSGGAEGQGRAPTPTPTPPKELPASTPRMAPAAHAASQERSQQKQQAMKSGNEDDIREALKASKARRGA
jgi:hypothetical protein